MDARSPESIEVAASPTSEALSGQPKRAADLNPNHAPVMHVVLGEVDPALTGIEKNKAEAAANFLSLSRKEYLANARPIEVKSRFWDGWNKLGLVLVLGMGGFSAMSARAWQASHNMVDGGFAVFFAAFAAGLAIKLRHEWHQTVREVAKPETDEVLLAKRSDINFATKVAQRALSGMRFGFGDK